jgi:hypothetical protein
MATDEERKKVLTGVLSDTAANGWFPPMNRLRVKFEDHRATIDELVRDGLIHAEAQWGVYMLTVGGLHATKPSDLAEDELRRGRLMLARLKQTYRQAPEGVTVVERFALELRQEGGPEPWLEPSQVRRAIFSLSRYNIFADMQMENGMPAQFKLNESVLDVRDDQFLDPPAPPPSTTQVAPVVTSAAQPAS